MEHANFEMRKKKLFVKFRLAISKDRIPWEHSFANGEIRIGITFRRIFKKLLCMCLCNYTKYIFQATKIKMYSENLDFNYEVLFNIVLTFPLLYNYRLLLTSEAISIFFERFVILEKKQSRYLQKFRKSWK